MKIAVCVKHVPAGRVRMHPDTLRIERSGPGELNAFDKHAIEAALRIAEVDGSETVVVSVGPARGRGVPAHRCCAMGVDRAVLVSDPAAESSDLVGTAKVLAAVLTREAADLSLFGQQASDGGGAVLWAAVADLLGQPFVSQASTLEVRDGVIVVSRETEYGNDVIEAPLPVLVAVSDAINEPRYTSLKGRMAAKKKPLDTLVGRRPRRRRRGRRRGGRQDRGARGSSRRRRAAPRSRSTTRPAHPRPSSRSSRSASSCEGARLPRAPRGAPLAGVVGRAREGGRARRRRRSRLSSSARWSARRARGRSGTVRREDGVPRGG